MYTPVDRPQSLARWTALALVVVACQAHSAGPGAPDTPTVASGTARPAAATVHRSPTPEPSAALGSTSPSSAPRPSRPLCPEQDVPPAATRRTPCGPLDCFAFASARDAMAYVTQETEPLVLAIGEIHAQKDSPLKASPTQRFANLLPTFCGTARHIVIELWTGRNDCGDNRVERVDRAQKPVTVAQAATNKNDFFELGNTAKANHIQPHALVPTCDDYQSILTAKDQDIARMLELTAARSADLAEKLLKAAAPTRPSPFILLYGGAMHNDLAPGPGRETFSFGPRLQESTHSRFTELDIVLREQVRDTETFRRMAWYPHFRTETLEKQFTLYRLGPRSFTLIFPSENRLP